MSRPGEITTDDHNVSMPIFVWIVLMIRDLPNVIMMTFRTNRGMHHMNMSFFMIMIMNQQPPIWPDVQQQGGNDRHKEQRADCGFYTIFQKH